LFVSWFYERINDDDDDDDVGHVMFEYSHLYEFLVFIETRCVSRASHYLVSPSQYLVDDVQLLADSGRRLLRSAKTEHASFHGHRVSATEPFMLLDLKSGTICHRNCDTWTSALDNSETC